MKDSISIPLLTAATLQDDESLQQKWACLLANAANPAAAVHPAFVEILAALAPLDAVVLDEAYKRLLLEMKAKGNFQIVFLESKAMQEVLVKALENGADTSLENLIRLRLVETVPEWVDESTVRSRPTHRYYITKLGHDFYLACQPPEMQLNNLGPERRDLLRQATALVAGSAAARSLSEKSKRLREQKNEIGS